MRIVMTPKTINCPLPLTFTEEKIVGVTSLCQASDAHLAVQLIALSPAAAFAGEEADRNEALTELEQTRRHATKRCHLVREWLGDLGVSATVDAFVYELNEIEALTGRHARYADLSIASACIREQIDLRDATFAGLLLGSGRPVLVEPANDRRAGFDLTPEVAMVAWDESLAASRAVSQSLDLLTQAQTVHIACVNQPESKAGGGGSQGAQLARYLERHGVDVSVAQLPPSSADIDRLLLAHLEAVDAQLLVMGAYGHAPFKGRIFGGTTIGILSQCPVPVLMAH